MSWKPRGNAQSAKPILEPRLDKRAKIIEASASCFLRLGYAETSLDEIAEKSGVVKQTIYNLFENKDAVFRAAIDHLLKQTAGEEYEPEWKQLSTAEFFERVGKHQIKSLAEPNTRDFLRLIVKECRRFPELQEIYAESIPKPFVQFVMSYFEQSSQSGSSQNQLGSQKEYCQAIAWTFRSAITGFATLSNLGQLLPYPLPNRSRYLQAASRLFARLVESDVQSRVLFGKTKSALKLEAGGTPALPGGTTVESDEVNASIIAEANGEGEEGTLGGRISVFFESQKAALGIKKIAILSAAIQVLSERGFADTSMEEIANVAKVSKQTVYKHFRSKNFLYSFLAKCIMGQLQTIALPSKDLPIGEYLKEFLQAFLQMCSKDWIREYFRVVFGESGTFPLESGLLLLFIMEHGRDQLEAKITEAFRGEDVDFSSISILLRSTMGSFILLSQIYVVAENPYLTENTLIELSEELLHCLNVFE